MQYLSIEPISTNSGTAMLSNALIFASNYLEIHSLYSLLYSLQLYGLFLFSTCYVVLSLYLLSATILSTLSTCRVYMALSGDIIPRRRNICFENRHCTKPVYLFTAFIQNRLNFYPHRTLYLSKLCVNCLEQSENLKSQFQIKISLHFT